jgi:hypothetical protein
MRPVQWAQQRPNGPSAVLKVRDQRSLGISEPALFGAMTK